MRLALGLASLPQRIPAFSRGLAQAGTFGQKYMLGKPAPRIGVPSMPKRGLGAQVAAFIVIVVCVVAAIGVLSLTQSEATSASSSEGTHSATSTVEATTCAPQRGAVGNATVTITYTAGQWPGCACALVDSNSNGTLYVSTNAVVGDDVCIAASMTKSTIVSFEVVGPAGVYLSTPGCVNSAFTAVSCATFWNTAQLYPGGGQVQPGDYELIATGDLQSLRANFTLSANPESSQTCITQSSSSSTSSGNGKGAQSIATPVTPNIYFNNSIYQGPPVGFTVKPGRTRAWRSTSLILGKTCSRLPRKDFAWNSPSRSALSQRTRMSAQYPVGCVSLYPFLRLRFHTGRAPRSVSWRASTIRPPRAQAQASSS
jgi:hypothetical protein